MEKKQQKIILSQYLEFCLESDSDLEFAIDISSSSDDEEEKTQNFIQIMCLYLNERRSKTHMRPRIKDYIEKIVPNYTAEEFKMHFRLLPETFQFLLELIGPALSSTRSISGRKPISAQKQLLMALWMMGTPDSYRSVCTKFNLGKATAIRTMRRVAYALHTLAPRFIKWPVDERAAKVMIEFEKASAFPNVLGAIDGTHIKIRAPQQDKQSYVNRKGYHSIHVQAVCTQNLLFTSVFAGNVGSVHDARVFRLSPVSQYVQDPEIYFPYNSHLVGDSAYGIHPCIMVPFKDNGHLTNRQKNFNFCLSSARIAIERAFGLWKGRWRSILDCLPMVTLEKIPEYLIATCVLHNICILKGDLIDFNETHEQNRHRGTLIPGRTEDGNVKRQAIMNNLIIRINGAI
ncbi:putative nuclease HARBI1 [Monomorium pharaonis]|uniref:putative nuclease HARBI1 n=1 Tax=Monomorium pharaonis TaxID=307658 RepID=UPI001746DCFC|nr:putative nuclease HARBI1 [Monomorium pharaonis]XP_036143899.1 putative nuclease HARBI1 [Monomorium pharaonis]XP_036150101.1 putative nuclease HARBI1 [Monomorium pharaonis]XP_036150196.1 putative nuclease HARBI1 [Monomorium pharaonis]